MWVCRRPPPPHAPTTPESPVSGSSSSLLETWCHFIFLLPAPERKRAQTKVLNPAESSRQTQSPSPAPPDMKTLTFTPAAPPPSPHLLLLLFHIYQFFFIFSLLRCLTSKPPCFPLKTFLFALDISALSPFCPLFFNMSIFSPWLFYFISPLASPFPSLPQLSPDAGEELLLSPSRDKSRVLSRRHSVRGFVAEADEISGAHLAALYGDLLGWDEQQASHHSQPNRLPSCMCLFLLRWQEQRHCQGWRRPPRPAACRRKPRPALRIITFY